MTNQPLILASQSPYRAKLLESTGLPFIQQTSHIDEDHIKSSRMHQPPSTMAIELAKAKANAVSKTYPLAMVIAADQLCVSKNNTILSKPGNKENAINQLKTLSGCEHRLINGLVIYQNQTCLWTFSDECQMHMRPLSENDIVAYIERDTPYDCCGSYKIESHGRSLFSHIQASSDAIQGLPLSPLLQAIRDLNILSNQKDEYTNLTKG
tara:strand:+ start:2138 stop:2764 length:627 start_codon:yes stop_codon:yes gene_type:complete